MPRSARISRRTGETEIELSLDLDGTGEGTRTTGVGFFDHLLDLLARHALVDLEVRATGDLQTGSHHTVEDVGLVLGQALGEALGDKRGIARYGQAIVPMDEARALCAIDLSGRPLLAYEDGGRLPAGATGGFEHELLEELLRAIAASARATVHLEVQAGRGAHHVMEAAIKAFARALRAAVADDPRVSGVPSTKGTLTA